MKSDTLARKLFDVYHRFRIASLHPSNCRYENIRTTIRELKSGSGDALSERVLGKSIEGRSISLLRFGTGPLHILLWSQMHGDEPTATLALMDLMNFLTQGGPTSVGIDRLERRCSLFFVPLLNPDGAERRSRYTSGWVDMNRDARAFSTPESRILRAAHRMANPAFGFNLHDQELSSVGETPAIAAIALLAPAADAKKTITPARKRAMHVAALIATALGSFASGKIARYNDGYEPRAFGERMQSWETSTVLLESGHWRGDPRKEMIRKLNFTGLMTAVDGIATGRYKRSPLSAYTGLKENAKQVHGLIVRNITLRHGRMWKQGVSIGLELLRRGVSGRVTHVRVREIGDLRGFGAFWKVDAGGKSLKSGQIWIEQTIPLSRLCDLLQIDVGEEHPV